MADPIIPFAVWESGTNQNSIPANDNSLRNEVLNGLVISKAVTAQPVSPSEGDIYIIAATHTGAQWSTFDPDDLVIFSGGTWYAFAPAQGVVVNFDAHQEQYTGSSGWEEISGGGGGGSTIGKQSITIMASAIRPSVTGGPSVATIASAANQPDISTVDFDPTTQEYAQFSIAMPKKWNEGTITFKPYWSHAATTTNFGVVWSLQAVAMANDDTILANFGTAQTSTDTGGTTSDVYIGPESSAITVAGTPGSEDLVFFRISRVTGDGGDTMAIDARLHGILLYVTTDADTDA